MASMLIGVREKREARTRAIKVLDHAMSGTAGTAACETFVDALGLKTLFSALMGKGGKGSKTKSAATLPSGEETAHILGIVASLFTNLPSDTPARIRVLAKFVEGNYEKVDKLLEVREGALGRLKVVDKEIDAERKVCRCISLLGVLALTVLHPGTGSGWGGGRRRGRWLVSPKAGRRPIYAADCGLYSRIPRDGRRRGESPRFTSSDHRV
jgi:hypothetical protein